MILNRRVALNGNYLDELHDGIVIRGITDGYPEETENTIARMGGVGMKVTDQHWNSLQVTVNFAILIQKIELATRQEIFDMVKTWALQKGWLTFSHKPGKRMRVDKVILPAAGDLWNWTNDFVITFIARNVPFWQQESPESVTIDTAMNVSRYVPVAGNVQTVLDMDFTNVSGMTISSLRISVQGRTIQLTGFSLANGQTLSINHGTDGLLRITAGGASMLNCRAEGSADDLYVDPGSRQVQISAQRSGRITLSATGRYL